jgi:signal transduction histidine kinase
LHRGSTRPQQVVELGTGLDRRILRGDVAALNTGDAYAGGLLSKQAQGGRVLLFQDVTKLIQLEDKLKQHEKLAAVGQLAAGIAHEIRNPLTVIKMLFHSLDLRFEPGDPRVRDVTVMGEKMEQLNRIVEQILDFARTSEPEFKPVDINRLLNDLALLVRHKLRNQNIEWIHKLAENLPAVSADSAQLEQAFLNLTLNAVEAMPKGGKLTITTKAQHTSDGGHMVMIEFRDTGDGMTEDQCKKVFSSLLKTTKRKGTGLGLAIVARIMEAHHGRIEVKSRPAKGTVFTLRLPLGS